MMYKGPPVHAAEFIESMLYAERRLKMSFRGRYFEYAQVPATGSLRGRHGTWYYTIDKNGVKRSLWSSYRSGKGTITQAVGPKGQWNPKTKPVNQRHECGHLVLFSNKVKADLHHDILRKAGLDYVR